MIKPRITEKAAIAADKANAYVFDVSRDANKRSIALAIKAKYKVTPIKVNVAKGKKAYVYLKKGDKIEII